MHSNDWENKKIVEIIVENKKSIIRSKGNNNGIYPFFVSGFNIKNIDSHLIDGDNIFLPTGGNFFVHYFKGKAAYSTDTWSIKTIENVDIKYLYYFLILNQDMIGKKLFKGATIKHLQKDDFKNLRVPVPLFSEQQRIVKILDDVFDNIAKAKENAEKNLANSKELFESYLNNVFTRQNEKEKSVLLEDICDIQSKLIDPRKLEFIDLIHVGAGNIKSRSGVLIDLKTAKEERLISGKFQFDNSMILYSKIRPYLMKVARPDFNGLCSADMYPLAPRDNILKDYLYYLLLTSNFTEYAIRGSARAGMPKVNREHLFAYALSIPSIDEQKSIVAKLDTLSTETKKLQSIYKQKIADLEELKKSVLAKAFSGEL